MIQKEYVFFFLRIQKEYVQISLLVYMDTVYFNESIKEKTDIVI